MGDGHNVEEPGEQAGVVDIPLHHEYAMGGQQRLAGLLRRRIIVAVEVVEPDDAIAALAEGEGNVRPDEACGASDEHGDGAGAARGGGGPDLFLQAHPTPRRTEVAGGDAGEALEAEVTGNEGDQEQCPKEHVAGRREASVELAIDRVRTLDLPLPGRRRKQLIFHQSHLLLLRFLAIDQWRRRGSMWQGRETRVTWVSEEMPLAAPVKKG